MTSLLDIQGEQFRTNRLIDNPPGQIVLYDFVFCSTLNVSDFFEQDTLARACTHP